MDFTVVTFLFLKFGNMKWSHQLTCPISYVLYYLTPDQPKLADGKSSYIHFAEHGKPTRIQITVGSYEIPSVAWTTNPGGKVGFWNVQNISAALYHISSEVIPTSTFHYGVYGIRVRNSIGQLNLEVEITCMYE